MRPSSVGAAKVEQEFADRVLACVQLDGDWRQTVLKALANKAPSPITAWMLKGWRRPWQTSGSNISGEL